MKYKKYLKIAIHKIVNLSLIATVLYLIISSIHYYNTWPIYTVTNIIPQNQAQFPAVTLCQQYIGYKKNILQVKQDFLVIIYMLCTLLLLHST